MEETTEKKTEKKTNCNNSVRLGKRNNGRNRIQPTNR